MWMAALAVPAMFLWARQSTVASTLLAADVVVPWLPETVEAQAWIDVLAAALAAAWGLGAAWHLFRIMRQLARIHLAVRLTPPEQVRATIRPVVFSRHVRSPMLVGYSHPRIVLPEHLRNAEPRLVRLICAHEEAHARRRDNWRLSAEHALLAVWFWCTPLRHLHTHLLAAREELCDRDALRHASMADRRAYAHVLLSSWRPSTPPAPMSCMTDGMAHARRRLGSILDPSFSAHAPRSLRALSAAAIVFLGTTCVVAVTPAISENLLTLSGNRGVSLRMTSVGDPRDGRGLPPARDTYHVKVLGAPAGHGDDWVPGDYRVEFLPLPDHGWKLHLVRVAR
jgi:beta-lactamase regulating signal transducer with metallopeptidase domain